MARTPSDLPGVGTFTNAVRIRRQTPRWNDEPRVALRRAVIDLGVGLWLSDPAAKAYAGELKSRGKPGGIIACALAHRATRIAYALVRDHATYNPSRWA